MRKRMLAWLGRWASWFMVYVNTLMMRHKLSKHAKNVKGTLLDVGCGDKPYRTFFVVDKYVGVNSRSYYQGGFPASIGRNTDVWIDDSLPLPFQRGSFDVVVCFQVLSVINNPDEYFTELARLVKPGGHLIVTTDFLYPKWAATDCLRHTDVSLRVLAENHGFEVLTIEGFGGWLTTVHCLVMRRVRDYPLLIDVASSGTRRVCRLALYLCWLATMPAWGIAGWIVFFLERSLTNDHTFTANHMLVARRIAD